MRVGVTLTAQTPLALRSGRDTERADTLDHIPGATLLGSLAGAHAALRPSQKDEFATLFLEGRVRFGNAYPATFDRDELTDDTCPVLPLPRTARSCKRFPGFRFQADPDHDYHGVTDQLIPWALFALSEERLHAPLEQGARCTHALPTGPCGQTTDMLRGYFRRGNARRQIGRSRVSTALVTRTGINRNTGTAEQAVLYSREVMRKGSRFWCPINVPDDLFAVFRAFVEEASAGGWVRVGTNRTRGLGRIGITSISQVGDDSLETLAARARQFTAALHEAAAKCGLQARHALYVPVTLMSDAILPDALFRYRTQLDSDYLRDESGITGAELVYHTAGMRRVIGWNDLAGLPKPDEIAIAMGSVFLFGFDREPDFAQLYRLQTDGIGTQTIIGFGRVAVADPFHWEVTSA